MIGDLFQPTHLIIVMVIVLIVFGPGKLPELGAAFGKGIKEFKKGAAELSNDTSHVSSAAPAPAAPAPVAAAGAPEGRSPVAAAPAVAPAAPSAASIPVPAAAAPAASVPAMTTTAVAVAEPAVASASPAAPVKCSKCGTLNQAGYRFCAGCGTQLTSAAA